MTKKSQYNLAVIPNLFRDLISKDRGIFEMLKPRIKHGAGNQHDTTIFSFSLFVFSLLLGFSSCTKEETNPYDDPSLKPPAVDTSGSNLPQGSFAWLHYKVFKPTCANSGCHDGTFEPDFRTINSSYNSLVYQPIIKNDVGGTYTYRVLPGNANLSVLMNRLTVDIDGQSGIMPLSVDPTSDWDTNKTSYIQAIKDWINNGAKDVYGNTPQPGNLLPQVTGVAGFKGGTNIALATDNNNVMQVPTGTASVDIVFALADDTTPEANLGYNKFKFATQLAAFPTAAENSLQVIAPQAGTGFYGDPVQFTRMATINTSAYAAGTVLFIRVYITDDNHPNPAEIPGNGTSPDMVQFFCVRII